MISQLATVTLEKKVTLENDFVLAMTGYLPDYEFFKKIGMQFHDDEYETPIYNEETLETNVPNLYIAGVVNAGKHTSKFFIENTIMLGSNVFHQYQKLHLFSQSNFLLST